MKAASIVRAVFLFLCLIGASPGASGAQTTTGRIEGYVRGAEGEDVAGAVVRARNTETNQSRQVSTAQNGRYVIAGLRPGPYELTVSRVGSATQTRAIQLGVGQTLESSFTLTTQAVQLEAITVAAPVAETRTSEVATNVTRQQVENLPTADRNFLSLATLAPGTQLQADVLDGQRKTFTAGAQGADQVNVFIDGASYKNDILQGGVAGQDASRGNPFPRNAIREFRIITQNFKAEYQKASSAIITASTRSGTNTWEVSGFLNYQDRSLIGLNSFQAREAQGNLTYTRPRFERLQFGASAGGPIIADRLHFFASFERNDQTRVRRVNIVPPSGYAALDSINFAAMNGEFDEPFEANLLFGKLSWQHTPTSFLEASYHLRDESDVRDFGNYTAYTAGSNFHNDVHTGVLKHTWTPGDFLNEATVSFQRYQYDPQPIRSDIPNRFFGFGCDQGCAQIGGNRSDQDFTQDRLSVRNDLTWSGLQMAGEHVIKGGFNVDFLNYDIVKRNNENPRFIYEPWFNNFAIPHRVEFQTGDPNFGANNTQLGLYLQDDWTPTPRLTLNLGVRWDYETHMMNYDYVTPQAVVDSISRHGDQLFIPVDPDRYFTDGDDREPFLGMIQPRLGFSLALDSEGVMSLFGGWGIFYDRTLFDHAIEESFALQHPSYTLYFAPPGNTDPNLVTWNESYLTNRDALLALLQNRRFNTPEVKLLPNDLRPPRAQHFSLGLRRAFGSWEVSAAYAGVRSENIMTFYWANEDFTCPARSFAVPNCFQHRTIPGWGNILLADDAGKTWYDALQVKVDRPYIGDPSTGYGWGAGLALTVAQRETEGFNDLFSFPNATDYGRQKRNDEPVRVVAHWITDMPFAWGIQFSGVVTLGTGTRQDVGGRFDCNNEETCFEGGGFSPVRRSFIVPDAFAYRNVDLRVRKEFVNFRGTKMGVSAELFNAFNYNNYGCYSTFNRTSRDFGEASCTISDPQRLQIGLEFNRQ